MKTLTTFGLAALLSLATFNASADDHDALAQAIDGDTRSSDNVARDGARNPYETLSFFGIEPDMTVVEIWPGGGWYTEILAPYLHEDGKLYAAHFDTEAEREYFRKSRAAFEKRVAETPAFANLELTEFAPGTKHDIAPAGSADMVLTFRNLHNWYMQGDEAALEAAFKAFYAALKPGGVLGVVDHRLPEDRPDEDAKTSGYMKQSWAVKYAEQAGFELADSSEVNANPKDTADHPRGVWSLPPSLALGDEDRESYIAIGESDRFTLKFVKP